MTEIDLAISSLQRAIEARRTELTGMEQALAMMQGSTGHTATPHTTEYEGLGITEATKRYLTEMGSPRETRDIADAIRQRGLTTQSRNFVATVYATLSNSSSFTRKDGLWTLARKRS